MVGLGSNPPEDAIYPLTFVDADGNPLTGEHDYVLRFDKQELPPVQAFWSVTLYDKDGFQVPNHLNRCALARKSADVIFVVVRPAKLGAFASWSTQQVAGPQDSTSWDPALPWMLPNGRERLSAQGHIRVSGPLYVSV